MKKSIKRANYECLYARAIASPTIRILAKIGSLYVVFNEPFLMLISKLLYTLEFTHYIN